MDVPSFFAWNIGRNGALWSSETNDYWPQQAVPKGHQNWLGSLGSHDLHVPRLKIEYVKKTSQIISSAKPYQNGQWLRANANCWVQCMSASVPTKNWLATHTGQGRSRHHMSMPEGGNYSPWSNHRASMWFPKIFLGSRSKILRVLQYSSIL